MIIFILLLTCLLIVVFMLGVGVGFKLQQKIFKNAMGDIGVIINPDAVASKGSVYGINFQSDGKASHDNESQAGAPTPPNNPPGNQERGKEDNSGSNGGCQCDEGRELCE